MRQRFFQRFPKRALLLSLALGLAACGSSPKITRPPITITRERRPEPLASGDVMPPRGQWDFWLEELQDYLPPREARKHLEPSPSERLWQNPKLLDFLLAQDLLQGAGPISALDRDRFQALVQQAAPYDELEDFLKRARARYENRHP